MIFLIINILSFSSVRIWCDFKLRSIFLKRYQMTTQQQNTNCTAIWTDCQKIVLWMLLIIVALILSSICMQRSTADKLCSFYKGMCSCSGCQWHCHLMQLYVAATNALIYNPCVCFPNLPKSGGIPEIKGSDFFVCDDLMFALNLTVSFFQKLMLKGELSPSLLRIQPCKVRSNTFKGIYYV